MLHFSRLLLEPAARPRHLNHDLYYFCRLLDRGGFEPIFVFDGVGRVPQKMKEVERRIAQRELEMERMIAEEQRGHQLQRAATLSSLLSNRFLEATSWYPSTYPLTPPPVVPTDSLDVNPAAPPPKDLEHGEKIEVDPTTKTLSVGEVSSIDQNVPSTSSAPPAQPDARCTISASPLPLPHLVPAQTPTPPSLTHPSPLAPLPYPPILPSAAPPSLLSTSATSCLEAYTTSQLEMLHDHFRDDLQNPIYSRNQRAFAHEVDRVVSAITSCANEDSLLVDRGSSGLSEHMREMFEKVGFGEEEEEEEEVIGEREDKGARLTAVIQASKILETRHRRSSQPLPFGALKEAEVSLSTSHRGTS